MPFDCTPASDMPKRSLDVGPLNEFLTMPSVPAKTRAIQTWYVSREPECVDAAVAVLVRARELISDERRWFKRAFAVTWLGLPVHAGSRFARRFCALGAIKRAGRELRLPVDYASRVLEWQTVVPVADWNDDQRRTHAEVVAAFDAAVVALDVAA
jgi:hypothetical protein